MFVTERKIECLLLNTVPILEPFINPKKTKYGKKYEHSYEFLLLMVKLIVVMVLQVISLTLTGANGDKQDTSTRGECSLPNDARNASTSRSQTGPFDHPAIPTRSLPSAQPVPSTSCALLVQSGSQTALPAPAISSQPMQKAAFDVFGPKSDEFRSPNVVVPPSSRPVPFAVPQPPSALLPRSAPNATISLRPNSSPFPFASMEHAAAAHSVSAARSDVHPENSLRTEEPGKYGPKPGAMSQIQVTYRPPTTGATLPGSKIQSSLFTVDARVASSDASTSRLPAPVPSTSTSARLLVARSDFPSPAVQTSSAISSPLLVNLLKVSDPFYPVKANCFILATQLN